MNEKKIDLSDLNMTDEELFAPVNHDELESERITAPRYSYWHSVFRVFFKKKINIVLLLILAVLLLFTYVYPVIIHYDAAVDPYINLMDSTAKHLGPKAAMAKFGNNIHWIFGSGSAGQSTFMVEMAEVASILKYATSRSLLILDEIGRGTSTYDGMAIARAVLEYAANPKRLGAKTLFATQYHELSTLEDKLPNVKNYNIAVKKRGEQMIFLRKIVPGATDDSYGIEVAKLAGIPAPVITRAREILAELESEGVVTAPAAQKEPEAQVSMMDLTSQQVVAALSAISVETLTPIEAMNELYKLKKMLD